MTTVTILVTDTAKLVTGKAGRDFSNTVAMTGLMIATVEAMNLMNRGLGGLECGGQWIF